MPFIASNGLTEAGTSRTVTAGGMRVHYHEAGAGEPVRGLSRHYRCILMDLPNFSKTGPLYQPPLGVTDDSPFTFPMGLTRWGSRMRLFQASQAAVTDGVVAVEDAIGELGLAKELPDVFCWVQFGRFRLTVQ